jgi:hypothetical protein
MDQVRQSHPRALGEVAELVRQHAGELPQTQPFNQRQADREHQPARRRRRPIDHVGRGVDRAIDLDSHRCRRAHGLADAVDEREHQGLHRGIELAHLRPPRRPGEQRLEHERDDDPTYHQRSDVNERRTARVADVLKDSDIMDGVQVEREDYQADQTDVDGGQDKHHKGDDQDPEAVQERRPDRPDLAAEGAEDLRRGARGTPRGRRPFAHWLRDRRAHRGGHARPGAAGRVGQIVGALVPVGRLGLSLRGLRQRCQRQLDRRLALRALPPPPGVVLTDQEMRLAARTIHADRHDPLRPHQVP